MPPPTLVVCFNYCKQYCIYIDKQQLCLDGSVANLELLKLGTFFGWRARTRKVKMAGRKKLITGLTQKGTFLFVSAVVFTSFYRFTEVSCSTNS